MREPLKDRIRIEHIIDSTNNVLNFTKGRSLADLSSDKMLFYAVVKNLEIIGEAAYHLTKAFRNKHPETEWNGIIRLRNILVHDYYQVNIQTIWDIVSHDLSPLQKQANQYLAETDWSEWEKDETAVAETAVHKSLIQTAGRMKSHGYDVNEICKITGLPREEIEEL